MSGNSTDGIKYPEVEFGSAKPSTLPFISSRLFIPESFKVTIIE